MGCHRVLASDLLVHLGVTDVLNGGSGGGKTSQTFGVKRTFIHPGWDLR
jgi:hypothetical protein